MTEAEQFDVILHGAAFAAVDDRAFLRVTGTDATRWLNGMVTNNIAALAPGEGNYNFLLNAQGRIQGDCTIYREPGDGPPTFLLATQNSQLETIQKTLDRFIIMDDVELSEFRVGSSHLLVLGLQSAAALNALGLPSVPINAYRIADSSDGPIAIFTNGNENVFQLVGEEDQIDCIRKKLAVPEVNLEALEAYRIYSGTPKFGIDIRDRDLPQETGQAHALHFAKGCYLGQEIVERIRSRGQVHRQFSRFKLTGELPVSLPAPLESNGKPAGELTSAALVPLPESPTLLALGYARREALDTHQPLTYPGGTASPTNNQEPTTENQHG